MKLSGLYLINWAILVVLMIPAISAISCADESKDLYPDKGQEEKEIEAAAIEEMAKNAVAEAAEKITQEVIEKAHDTVAEELTDEVVDKIYDRVVDEVVERVMDELEARRPPGRDGGPPGGRLPNRPVPDDPADRPAPDDPVNGTTLITPPPPAYIPWKPSIEQAIDSARNNPDKMIIVWFRNSDCDECIDMERNVFNDPDVIAHTRKWLFVKVDTDRMNDREEGYLSRSEPPVLVFLSKDGLEAHRYNGAVTSEEFITMLQTWR